jgi:bifunctional DNase/RNase
MIRVTVDSVRVSLLSQNRVVVLRESDSRRYLPIWIGQFEAESISLVLQNLEPSRPMTHDLLKTTISALGGTITQVIISDILDNVFVARIIINTAESTLELDARSSDAIAIAVRCDVPIFVAPHVFDQASVPFDSDEQNEPPVFRSSETPAPAEPAEPPPSDESLSIFRDFINSLDKPDNNNPDKTDQ